MIYFLDTNIFLRTLVKENEEVYKNCYSLLNNIKHNKYEAVTSHLVLAEISWTLSSYYKFPKNKVILGLNSIINLRGLTLIDNFDMSQALVLYKNKEVKYIDSMIASMPELQMKKWSIVSYDHDFDKLGVKRIEPQNLINS
jgi:uncharacterized protein